VRSDNVDCPVADNSANCPTSRDTYGDVDGIGIHTDGQVWAQTLWDLRTALGGNGPGADAARDLVTQAMRLAPAAPTYLDMRNAIIQADQALFAGAGRAAIWDVFAARGMGFLAHSGNSEADAIEEDFTDAPAAGAGVTATGRVTDADTGAPVAGALVEFGQLPGDQAGLTDANGEYSVSGLVATTYPHLRVTAPGYELIERDVTVSVGSTRVDQTLRRNFAAASGGATAAIPAGAPDFTGVGCGPAGLIDGDLGVPWASRSQTSVVAPGEKSITIALPNAVDVSALRIDPGAGCGDDDTASVGGFRVETSADGASFTRAAGGTFTAAANHRLNEIAVDRDGVRFVRFVAETPQRQNPGDDGRDFLDAAELEVLGVPTPPPPATGPVDPGAPQTQPQPQPQNPGPGGNATPPDLTAPIGALRLVSRQRVRRSLSRGLKVTVECNEPCSARLTATLDARTAKRLRLLSRRSRARTVRVASGSLRIGPGRRTARLRFTGRARRLLKRQKRVKLVIAATLTDQSGNRASRRLTASLAR
jgi:hypothetical protein